MARKFVVVDSEGNISWSDKTESGESFATQKAAEKRAAELAESSPGSTVGVYQRVSIATAPVGKVEIEKL